MTDCIRAQKSIGSEHNHVSVTSAGKAFARLDYIYCNRAIKERVVHLQIVSDHMDCHSERIEAPTSTDKIPTRHATTKQWDTWQVKATNELAKERVRIAALCQECTCYIVLKHIIKGYCSSLNYIYHIYYISRCRMVVHDVIQLRRMSWATFIFMV